MTDLEHVPDRQSGNWREGPVRKATGCSVPKNRQRLSKDAEKLDKAKLIVLLISAIEPVAKLIDAISRIH